MKTQHSRGVCPEEYLTAIGKDPARVIYFDIETTGFRASSSQLYMIGWALRETASPAGSNTHPGWEVTQLLAESRSEERSLLEQFALALQRCDTIIAFNGDRFDLPYLKEKYAIHHMSDPFEGIEAVDLYREIRPCRSLLGLKALNQKSVEQFLSISRKDPFSGGELIDVYRSVRSHTASDPEDAAGKLYLHNREDVLGMLAMTPLLAYPMMFTSESPVHFSITDPAGLLVETDSFFSADAPFPLSFEAFYDIPVPFPRDVEADCAAYRLLAHGNRVHVTIPLCTATLYHFFPNYRDYYYLPHEDTAVHKSVGHFVDPAYRKNATARTCYVKKEGVFLPQVREMFTPSFKSSYQDSLLWFEAGKALTLDPDAFSAYIRSLVLAASSAQ